MTTTIITPTLNESENLPELVRRIRASVDSTTNILIVDDSSDNKTTHIAHQLGCEVIHPAGGSLSKAVVTGIRATNSEKTVVMDADCQHPPEYLSALMTALETHDFVVMSRYVSGGGCKEWDFDRKVISRIANLLARPLCPKVHDLVSGFFGFHRKGLPDLSTVNTRGYKCMLEFLVRGTWVSVAEVPFTFAPRTKGESKLSRGKITDYVLQLAALYLYKFGRNK